MTWFDYLIQEAHKREGFKIKTKCLLMQSRTAWCRKHDLLVWCTCLMKGFDLPIFYTIGTRNVGSLLVKGPWMMKLHHCPFYLPLVSVGWKSNFNWLLFLSLDPDCWKKKKKNVITCFRCKLIYPFSLSLNQWFLFFLFFWWGEGEGCWTFVIIK